MILFNFDDVVLKTESKVTHVGHIIAPNVYNNIISDVCYTLIHNVNYVLSGIMHCSYNIKYPVFNLYCTPFYGCPLWDINGHYISSCYVTWRKSVRKLFDISWTIHCNLFPAIAECRSIECQELCHISQFT